MKNTGCIRLLVILASFLSIGAAAQGQPPPNTPAAGNTHPARHWTYIFELDSAGKTTLIDSVADLPGTAGKIIARPGRGSDTAAALKKAIAGGQGGGTNSPKPALTDTASKQAVSDAAAGKPSQRRLNWLILLFTALVGGSVGFSEMLNRYKSYNLPILRNLYSLTYMFINALAAVLFYWIVVRYDLHFGPLTERGIGLVLTCGLGAMAFLRSSFFNYKDAAGKVLEIGPAALLTIYLRAAERNFDQCIASNCMTRLAPLMNNADLKIVSASKDLPLLVLTSMQVLSDDEQKAMAAEVAKMVADTQTTEDVKKILLGTILERYSGFALLKECVEELISIYKNQTTATLTVLDAAASRL